MCLGFYHSKESLTRLETYRLLLNIQEKSGTDFLCRENTDKSLIDNLLLCCYCEDKFIERVRLWILLQGLQHLSYNNYSEWTKIRAETKAARLRKIEYLLLMHPEGLTQSEIARQLNVNQSAVNRYLPDLPSHISIDDMGDCRYS